MAVVQNTLIGRSRGSVGGATFSSWKGLNVLKSKAVSVANPNTVGQQTQRNRMTLIVAIYRAIASAIQIGFRNEAINKSEYNAFVSENIISATDDSSAPTVTFDPAELKTAIGTMGVIPITGIAGTNASPGVDVDWDDALEPVGSRPDDIATVVVYNATQDIWGVNSEADRQSAAATVTMPENSATSDVLHAYLFFSSTTDESVSDSTYSTDNV